MKETIIHQYRKKPVIVEAVQLNNINAPCVVRWVGEDKAKMKLESDEAWKLGKAPPIFSVTICTLEGDMKAMPGDYIIKGVHGEFYPCKPDIFEKTYEAVEPPKEESKAMPEYISREAAIIGLAASNLTPHQIDDAAEALQLVPAADVAPVRHGKWIQKGRKIYCSKCNRGVYIGTDDEGLMQDEMRLRRFCSACGAKMDGDGE